MKNKTANKPTSEQLIGVLQMMGQKIEGIKVPNELNEEFPFEQKRGELEKFSHFLLSKIDSLLSLREMMATGNTDFYQMAAIDELELFALAMKVVGDGKTIFNKQVRKGRERIKDIGEIKELFSKPQSETLEEKIKTLDEIIGLILSEEIVDGVFSGNDLNKNGEFQQYFEQYCQALDLIVENSNECFRKIQKIEFLTSEPSKEGVRGEIDTLNVGVLLEIKKLNKKIERLEVDLGISCADTKNNPITKEVVLEKLEEFTDLFKGRFGEVVGKSFFNIEFSATEGEIKDLDQRSNESAIENAGRTFAFYKGKIYAESSLDDQGKFEALRYCDFLIFATENIGELIINQETLEEKQLLFGELTKKELLLGEEKIKNKKLESKKPQSKKPQLPPESVTPEPVIEKSVANAPTESLAATLLKIDIPKEKTQLEIKWEEFWENYRKNPEVKLSEKWEKINISRSKEGRYFNDEHLLQKNEEGGKDFYVMIKGIRCDVFVDPENPYRAVMSKSELLEKELKESINPNSVARPRERLSSFGGFEVGSPLTKRYSSTSI